MAIAMSQINILQLFWGVATNQIGSCLVEVFCRCHQ